MKILVSGDIHRPNPQFANIEWLYFLIRNQIEAITKIKPQVLSRNTWTYSQEDWRVNFFTKEDYLEKDLTDTLLIGFELPQCLKNQCDTQKIPYIEVCIGPIRFASDIMFSVKTNYPVALDSFLIDDWQLKFEAGVVSAASAHRKGIRTPENTLLIIGQTPFDRVVATPEKFLSLNDYKNELTDLIKSHHHVFYKPHPFNHNDEIDLSNLVEGVTVEKVLTINTYTILSNPNIKTVTGISSSVLAESPYFGKESICLYKKWWDGYAHVDASNFLSPKFWDALLHPIMPTYSCLATPKMSRDVLRKTIGAWWGMDILK